MRPAVQQATAAKRNSAPIEMDTSGQRRPCQRPHFKRRLFSSPLADRKQVRQRRGSSLHEDDENEEEEDDDDEDDDDRSSERIREQLSPRLCGFIESQPPKVEDEMMFELQQVDQVEDSPLGQCATNQAAGAKSQRRLEHLAANTASKQHKSSADPLSSNNNNNNNQAVNLIAASKQQQFNSPKQQQQQLQQMHTIQQQHHQRQHQHQLRFIMGANPAKVGNLCKSLPLLLSKH